MPDFRLPRIDQRISIIGRTGSGKTHGAAWILSRSAFDRQPFVIVDYKYDSLLCNIPRIEEIGVNSRIPRNPGLYIIHPQPTEIDEVEGLMERVWYKENTGFYIDEAHMLPSKGAFQSLLTQGRSKQIPMIVVTQRPAWVSKFVFSEADFFCVYDITDRQDRKRIEEFVPINLGTSLSRPYQRLQKYHSWYHDISENVSFHLTPFPDRSTVLQNFSDRMPRSWFGSSVPRRRLAV
jgi:hypothetical protein